jgi:membrane-bound serine protease (ClpP class)
VRRLVIALLGGPLVALAGLASGAAVASSSPDSTVPSVPTSSDGSSDVSVEATDDALAPVDVLQVTGLFNGIVIQAIDDAIERAADDGSQALILQVNSGGSIASPDEMTGLIQRVADSPVPIGIWVGPSGSARLYGMPAQLMGVADVTAMVSGSRIGHTGRLVELEGATVDFGAAADRLRSGSLSFQDARTLGALKLDTPDVGVPTIRNMVAAMDGVTVDGVVLDTVSEGVNDEGGSELQATLVRFSKLGLLDQLMHTVASPPVAYLMLLIGLSLLVFEFFTAGVGVAGVVGAVCAFLGCFGLAELPARGWAVALLVLAFAAFAVDVQVGIPRFWTGVGVVLVTAGSLVLYEPLPGTSMGVGWLTMLVGIGGTMLTFIVGMPSMTRTRFATPTIGREWMIGEMGTAVGEIAPEGVVTVANARWRARTNRATPVPAGAEVRVVAIDGVTLEVEPAEGGARDYRERRPSTGEQGQISQLTPSETVSAD